MRLEKVKMVEMQVPPDGGPVFIDGVRVPRVAAARLLQDPRVYHSQSVYRADVINLWTVLEIDVPELPEATHGSA